MFTKTGRAASVTHVRLGAVGGNRLRISEVASDFRMIDGGEAAARREVLVGEIIFGTANRGPCETERLGAVEEGIGRHTGDDLLNQIIAIGEGGAAIFFLKLSVFRRAEHMIEARLVGELFEGDRLALERTEAGEDENVVLADGEAELRNADGGMAGSLALNHEAVVDIGRHCDFGTGVDGLVNGDVDELAGTGEIAKVEGGEDGDGRILTGDMVRVPHRGGDWWSIPRTVGRWIVAAYGHNTAHRHLG